MAPTTLEKIPLADILSDRGISTTQLARMAGIHTNVTARAVKSGSLKTHVTCALAIAKALGLEVSDIFFPNGLSDNGRPCHTGVAIGTLNNTEPPALKLCTVHFTELPVTGVCDDCA